MIEKYVVVPEVEDYLLNSPFRNCIIKMLKSGRLKERVELCKIIRSLQKKFEEKVSEKKMLLDRCELDCAVYCGFLYEPWDIKLKRWQEISKKIGKMNKPDLVLFFKFYDKEGNNDQRKNLIAERKSMYFVLQYQFQQLWNYYCNKYQIPIKFIEPLDNIIEKFSLVKQIIEENNKKVNKIVFTGPSHSGKTTCINYLVQEGIAYPNQDISLNEHMIIQPEKAEENKNGPYRRKNYSNKWKV
jgi:ABC-type multidrug transport system fused ATPase/permease subunit